MRFCENRTECGRQCLGEQNHSCTTLVQVSALNDQVYHSVFICIQIAYRSARLHGVTEDTKDDKELIWRARGQMVYIASITFLFAKHIDSLQKIYIISSSSFLISFYSCSYYDDGTEIGGVDLWDGGLFCHHLHLSCYLRSLKINGQRI